MNVEREIDVRGGDLGGDEPEPMYNVRGRDNHLYDDINNFIHYPKGGEDAFIPIGVNGETRSEITMECSSRCFPRSVSLGITYWQFSNYQKDLLSAELELD